MFVNFKKAISDNSIIHAVNKQFEIKKANLLQKIAPCNYVL
jgi:hypothetical protein